MSRCTLVFLMGLSLLLITQLYMERHFLIYGQTLRFHVRADSDDDREQALKLCVRDAILDRIQGMTEGTEGDMDALRLERLLSENEDEIRGVAEQCIEERGFNENVKVRFVEERFPVRQYGGLVFPAGLYRALRVDIGAGKGHNWWCALYPELCYNKDEYALSEEGQRQIKENLSDLEHKILTWKGFQWFRQKHKKLRKPARGRKG